MNQKLLIASTLVIAATFAFSFAAFMDNQAEAQRPDRNVAQNAQNEIRAIQNGLINANVAANVQANCAVNVLAECQNR